MCCKCQQLTKQNEVLGALFTLVNHIVTSTTLSTCAVHATIPTPSDPDVKLTDDAPLVEDTPPVEDVETQLSKLVDDFPELLNKSVTDYKLRSYKTHTDNTRVIEQIENKGKGKRKYLPRLSPEIKAKIVHLALVDKLAAREIANMLSIEYARVYRLVWEAKNTIKLTQGQVE